METEAALDLEALGAITDAVESGRGLPDVVRAAARALDASLVLIDRSSAVLAVAARSSADERALMADASGVGTHELRVGDATVGRLRVRGRSGEPAPALLRLVTTLIASEVERVRAPERASEAAQEGFLRAVLHRTVTDRGDIVARAAEVGVHVEDGAAVVVVRAHHFAPAEEDWRRRVLAAAERAARAAAPGAIAGIDEVAENTAGQVLVLAPGDRRRRVAPHRRGDRARAPGDAARLHLRGRLLARRHRPGRPLPRRQRGAARRQRRRGPPRRGRRRRRGRGGARLRGDGRLPAPAARDERGPRRAAALLRRDGRAARRLRRPVRDRPGPDARDVPRVRRQRRRTPRRGCSPTATPSATGSSGSATSPGSTSPRPTGARSSASG